MTIDQSTRLVSTVTEQATLELSLQTTAIKPLGEDEVLIRVEAAPMNPSDQAVLFAFADLSTGRQKSLQNSMWVKNIYMRDFGRLSKIQDFRDDGR